MEVFADILDALKLETEFEEHKLNLQLKQVAKLIKIHEKRKSSRDVFYVRQRKWDMHNDVVEDLAELMKVANSAIVNFVSEMKKQKLFDNVVLLTHSDFGRTLQVNQKGQTVGSDHGWAGNHVVVGGALRGGQVLNRFPDSLLENNKQWEKRGRMKPLYPWESVMVPIAKWMGVATAQLDTVFPNLHNFNSTHIIAKADLFK